MAKSLEVVPGRRIGPVVLGQTRTAVEGLLGPPSAEAHGNLLYCQNAIEIEFDGGERVCFAQCSYSQPDEPIMTFRGITLSCRAYNDVIADLAAVGIHGIENDVGHSFWGWGLFTMDSLMVCDIEPDNPDDERSLLDGAWVRPID